MEYCLSGRHPRTPENIYVTPSGLRACRPCGRERRRIRRRTGQKVRGLDFWEMVDKSGECWLWMRGRDKKGYGRVQGGRFGLPDMPQVASRVAWHITFGPIPEGLAVLHRCDNPPCVRPDHLFLGTNKVNTHDMMRKGRQRLPPPQPQHGAHNPIAKLTDEKVQEMRRLYRAGVHYTEIAQRYGMSASRTNAIVRGAGWSHVTGE